MGSLLGRRTRNNLNSMRPPPLLLVTGEAKRPAASQEPLREITEEETIARDVASHDQPTQSTCSPSPAPSSPKVKKKQDDTETNADSASGTLQETEVLDALHSVEVEQTLVGVHNSTPRDNQTASNEPQAAEPMATPAEISDEIATRTSERHELSSFATMAVPIPESSQDSAGEGHKIDFRCHRRRQISEEARESLQRLRQLTQTQKTQMCCLLSPMMPFCRYYRGKHQRQAQKNTCKQ